MTDVGCEVSFMVGWMRSLFVRIFNLLSSLINADYSVSSDCYVDTALRRELDEKERNSGRIMPISLGYASILMHTFRVAR
jgi:hypothetical protein